MTENQGGQNGGNNSSNRPNNKNSSNNRRKKYYSKSKNDPRNRNNNNRNRNNNRPHHQKDGPNFLRKYDHLFTQYIQCRKKFFDLFFRADRNQSRKLENNYMNAITALRDFERRLPEHQKEALQRKYSYGKEDLTYSSSFDGHEMQKQKIEVGNIQDPHITETQINLTSYKDDTEESVGTVEDYNNYKS